MLFHRVLQELCEKNNIAHYSHNQDLDKQLPCERIFNGEDFIAARNGCFGPVRFFVPSAALNSAKIILHVRDPRDVLTSMFFSYCFMHPGEIAPDTGSRKEVADAGIDKFVLDMTDENFTGYEGDYGTGREHGKYVGNVRDRYFKYLREFIGKPNTVVVSYEEMMLDFSSWLKKVVAVFELNHPDETYRFLTNRIKPEIDVTRPATCRQRNITRNSNEDVRSHKRRATPGDYKTKLRPETVLKLNARFSEVLDVLGYADTNYEKGKIPIPKRW